MLKKLEGMLLCQRGQEMAYFPSLKDLIFLSDWRMF